MRAASGGEEEEEEDIAMQPLRSTAPETESTTRATTDHRRQDGAPWYQRLRYNVTHIPPSALQSIAFFAFGLLNNALYVVILTAALELIPTGTPTGVVAFANIAPALIAKAVWPYVLKGEVRYARRVWSCVGMNLIGILIIAYLPALWTRLAGISIASFSSGLGELTYLQLSTRYGRSGAGRGVGWFSSGTGAAGLVGAAAWWLVRPLGVQTGLSILTVLPLLMGISYGVILPSVEAIEEELDSSKGDYRPVLAEEYDVRDSEEQSSSEQQQQRDPQGRRPSLHESAAVLAVSPHASFISGVDMGKDISQVRLSLQDKMQLIKPMLFVFILPLVLVYFFEYTINQGVAPTLLYPLPTSANHPLLALIIKRLKDYYPLYQLTYQTFVFLSRSSVSIFRLPAIPKEYLWLPAILQGSLLLILISESVYQWFRESIASPLVIVLICVEGLAGGSAYVSVFYQIGTQDDRQPQGEGAPDAEDDLTLARRAQEHEFRIGCVGVGDTMGILLAALISIPLELSLCKAQVQRGRQLCKQL